MSKFAPAPSASGGSTITYSSATVAGGASPGASAGSLSTTLTGGFSWSVISGPLAVNATSGALTTTHVAPSNPSGASILAVIAVDNGTDGILKHIAVPVSAGVGATISQHVSKSQASTTSNTLVFSATAAAGSLLLLGHSYYAAGGGFPGAGVGSPPSGWTLLDANDGTTTSGMRIYYKVADGTEASVTLTQSSSDQIGLSFYEVRGATSVSSHQLAFCGNVSSATASSLTSSSAGSLGVVFAGQDSASTATYDGSVTSDGQDNTSNGHNIGSGHGAARLAAGVAFAPVVTFSGTSATQIATVIVSP